MPIVLYRVDERLLHGQVVVGWGSRLHPARYVIADDELAGSDWEQELYQLTLGEDAEAEFATITEARTRLDEWRQDPVRTVLLTRRLASMVELAEGGALEGEEVNLGGIHHAPGRTAVRSYLHLGEGERDDLRRLAELGVHVMGRELPDSTRVGLDALLNS